MNIFVVMKDGQPAHVTLCEHEASDRFDHTVESDDYTSTSLMVVATSFKNTSVLRRARQSA